MSFSLPSLSLYLFPSRVLLWDSLSLYFFLFYIYLSSSLTRLFSPLTLTYTHSPPSLSLPSLLCLSHQFSSPPFSVSPSHLFSFFSHPLSPSSAKILHLLPSYWFPEPICDRDLMMKSQTLNWVIPSKLMLNGGHEHLKALSKTDEHSLILGEC